MMVRDCQQTKVSQPSARRTTDEKHLLGLLHMWFYNLNRGGGGTSYQGPQTSSWHGCRYGYWRRGCGKCLLLLTFFQRSIAVVIHPLTTGL
jgi:hypothetical protein